MTLSDLTGPLAGLLADIALLWVAVTTLAALLSHNWRWTITALALQYIGIFILVSLSWTVETSVVKLVAGWMSSAVLGSAISEAAVTDRKSGRLAETAWPAGRLFRVLAASLVWLVVYSLAPRAQEWLPQVSPVQSAGGLILICMGLLQLGLTAHPLRVTIGLLTALGGFEILYAAVESSTLVAGLMAAATLGLALSGAYLLIAPHLEPE